MKIKFVQEYINKVRKDIADKVVWSVPYHEPSSTFEKIVCPLGFGYSGSGVLLDLLAEFSNVTTLGVHDDNGSKFDSKSYGELDFLRRFGGLLDLESAFTTRNTNIRDFKLKCYITLAEYYYSLGAPYTDKFYQLTREFINKLIDFEVDSKSGCEANPAFMYTKGIIPKYSNLLHPFLKDKFTKKPSYYLKELSVDEYIQIAAEYIKDFLKTIESKEYIVLDQFMSDCNADFEKIFKYLGPCAKCIAVYRDPRDVWATGAQLNVPWIPRDAETFVKWYKYSVQVYKNASHSAFLMIRFEDFIFDYENSVRKVCEFLSLDEKCHVKKREYFVPEISMKNVGLYKQYSSSDVLEYIEKELSEFCYKGE